MFVVLGIPLPVFSLMCSCKKNSDSFLFTDTDSPAKNHQVFELVAASHEKVSLCDLDRQLSLAHFHPPTYYGQMHLSQLP